jgi:hypothetical protein
MKQGKKNKSPATITQIVIEDGKTSLSYILYLPQIKISSVCSEIICLKSIEQPKRKRYDKKNQQPFSF